MLQLGTQTKKRQQKTQQQKPTCLHANGRLGHLFTLEKGQGRNFPPKLYIGNG